MGEHSSLMPSRNALISAPHCPVDQSACLTAGNCPAGCPNLAAQVVTWLASVNAKAKNVKFSTLSFDGEDGGGKEQNANQKGVLKLFFWQSSTTCIELPQNDAPCFFCPFPGESATAWALCQFKLLGDELGIPEVGMAKSIAAGPQSPGQALGFFHRFSNRFLGARIAGGGPNPFFWEFLR